MHEVNVLYNYLIAHKGEVLGLIGGGAGVSVILEVILKKLKVNSKKLAYTLLHVATVLTTAATFYLSNLKSFDVLPVYATLTLLAQTWHRFVISPAYNKYIVPYLNYLENGKTAKTVATAPTPAATDNQFE